MSTDPLPTSPRWLGSTYICLSTDTKPVTPAHGLRLWETDTKKRYLSVNGVWTLNYDYNDSRFTDARTPTVHSSDKHTGTIGTESQITMSVSTGHYHTGSDSKTLSGGGTSPVKQTLQRIALEFARIGSLTTGTMVDGRFDDFQDSNGIDAGLSTGYTYDAVNKKVTPHEGSWSNSYNTAPDTQIGSMSSYSVRQKVGAALLTTSGSKTKLTIKAGSGGNLSLNNVSIGKKAASGNAWDTVNTPVNVLFSGNANITITANNSITSDEVEFAIDHTTDNIIVTYDFSSASLNYIARKEISGGINYNKSGSASYNQATPTGFAQDGATRVLGISKIETYDPPVNMSLISTAVTANATPTKASDTLLVKGFTGGDTMKVYISSATSPAWTEITGLTEVATNVGLTGVSQFATDEIDYSGSADKSMRYKVEMNAGEGLELHGACAMWG